MKNDYLVQKNMDNNNFSVKLKRTNGEYSTNWSNISTKLDYNKSIELFNKMIKQSTKQKKFYKIIHTKYKIGLFLDDNKIKEVEV